jgi:hypothetical protein
VAGLWARLWGKLHLTHVLHPARQPGQACGICVQALPVLQRLPASTSQQLGAPLVEKTALKVEGSLRVASLARDLSM